MEFNKDKRDLIAITGCGSVSPVGYERTAIYSNYRNEETGIVNKTFNNKSYPVAVLPRHAEEQLVNLILDNPKCKKVDKCVLMAMKSATLAFEEAGWKKTPGKITGVNLGSSRGAAGLFEELHEEFLRDRNNMTSIYTSPLTTLGYVSNHVASHLNLTGPVINTSVTCSTGLQAICNAIAWIRSGMVNRFIAGGTEAPLTKFIMAQVDALGIYSKLNDTKYPCMPLAIANTNENSFVLGEGAASFAIEKLNITELRDRKVLGIIESIGFSFERPPTLTGVSEDGSLMVASMKMALDNMITNNNVDMILLHCPGTIKGDEAELNAVKQVFKSDIPNLYSNKWKIGHTYSASPALSLELGLICLQNNYSPSFPYKTNVKNQTRYIRKIMINSTGFGGNATSIIVSHPDIFR